jgi:hypothetical protein
MSLLWSRVTKYNRALRTDSVKHSSTSPRLFQALRTGPEIMLMLNNNLETAGGLIVYTLFVVDWGSKTGLNGVCIT